MWRDGYYYTAMGDVLLGREYICQFFYDVIF